MFAGIHFKDGRTKVNGEVAYNDLRGRIGARPPYDNPGSADEKVAVSRGCATAFTPSHRVGWHVLGRINTGVFDLVNNY
jgi:hypothetical protein